MLFLLMFFLMVTFEMIFLKRFLHFLDALC